MTDQARHQATTRRFALPTIIAGAAGALLVAFSMTPTFAALTASITNSTNTAGTASLIMQETANSGAIICNSNDGAAASTNTATCATINKYGGSLSMKPGDSVTTAITIKNTGSIPATAFTLVPGSCTQSNNGSLNGTATDLCAQYTITITSGSTSIYTGTAAAFTSSVNLLTKLGISSVASGTSIPFTFQVTLASGLGATYQGLQISQPLTWNFTA